MLCEQPKVFTKILCVPGAFSPSFIAKNYSALVDTLHLPLLPAFTIVDVLLFELFSSLRLFTFWVWRFFHRLRTRTDQLRDLINRRFDVCKMTLLISLLFFNFNFYISFYNLIFCLLFPQNKSNGFFYIFISLFLIRKKELLKETS